MAVAAAVYSRQHFPGLTQSQRLTVVRNVMDDAKRTHVERLLAKYDTNGHGCLNREEATKMLTDMDSSTPSGTCPTEEEVDFIFKQADVHGTLLGNPDGKLDTDELQYAIALYSRYLGLRPHMDRLLADFDGDKSGTLDQNELRAYMARMKGEKQVDDREVNWLMQRADISKDGTLDKGELLRGTVEWYTLSEKQKLRRSKTCAVA
mmetsp:Transcript_5342/g.15105  ORF Transcript_5342/g.15105 Transcript_5342/m.15105 type:complete len:206 (+) Transcript_5342:81-698(+)